MTGGGLAEISAQFEIHHLIGPLDVPSLSSFVFDLSLKGKCLFVGWNFQPLTLCQKAN